MELGNVEYWKDKHMRSQVPVAHTYDPSYSGSRDQEECGSKPARANSLW
jgi:hypothetical protein